MGRKGSGGSACLELGLKLAVSPSGKDEVNPGEDVSGCHHTEDDLEQKDELFERLKIGCRKKGRDGGGGGDSLFLRLRPLVQAALVPASVVGGGEPVTDNTGLQLCLWLWSALDLAFVKTTLDTESKSVWDLRWDMSRVSDL